MKKTKLLSILFLIVATILLAACTTRTTGNVVQQIPETTTPTTPTTPVSTAIPVISVVSYPDVSNVGDMARIMWRVDSPTPLLATHTAIHYDTNWHPGNLGTDIGPAQGGYPGLTSEYLSGSFGIPSEFVTDIKIPDDATQLYFRAHAMVDGKNYWTNEYSIKINKITPTPTTPTTPAEPVSQGGMPINMADFKQYSVVVDDNSITPETITVNTSEYIALTFKVSPANVESGALQFSVMTYKYFWGSTGDVMMGTEKTVYFQAPDQPRVIDYGVYTATGGNLLQIGHINVVQGPLSNRTSMINGSGPGVY